VSRDDGLSAAASAELEALERILARERVGEEHLELAALVESVRAGAPRIDPAFEAALRERLVARRRRVRGRGRAPRGRAWFAAAASAAIAAAVTLAIVLPGGSVPHQPPSAGGPAMIGQGVKLPARAGAHATASGSQGALSFRPSAASPAKRLVARGSVLVLAATPSHLRGVAAAIVAATERAGGIVETSNVHLAGRHSGASFTLQVPSGRLGRLLATLSGLGSVRSLTQGTHDITAPYDREHALLGRRLATVAMLRRDLARAATLAQAKKLRRQIAALEQRIRIERATIARLQREGHEATLAVTLVAAAGHHSKSAGALATGYHDALRALEDILAIALVVLAIALPCGLTALGLWWAAFALRQRARERALHAA
jgi:Domain of unknown function (DUF4349)